MIRNLLIIVVLTILPSFAMAEVWYCGPLKTVEVFSARQTEGVSSDKLVMNVGEKKIEIKKNLGRMELRWSYRILANDSKRLTALDYDISSKKIGSLVFSAEDKILAIADLLDTLANDVGGSVATYSCSKF
jgi:hypothetical protein